MPVLYSLNVLEVSCRGPYAFSFREVTVNCQYQSLRGLLCKFSPSLPPDLFKELGEGAPYEQRSSAPRLLDGRVYSLFRPHLPRTGYVLSKVSLVACLSGYINAVRIHMRSYTCISALDQQVAFSITTSDACPRVRTQCELSASVIESGHIDGLLS